MEKAKITTQISAMKESDGEGGLLQAKLATNDTTISDLQTRMLELQHMEAHLEKMFMEKAELRDVATQPTKYQHAVEENKQLKENNQELGNALVRAHAELQMFKESNINI